MALIIDNIRRREKRSTVASEVPTIPPNEDHTTGSWVATDLHEGELLINEPDGQIYSRSGSEILHLSKRNEVNSGINAVNGADAVTFSINTGTFTIKSRVLVHPTIVDEVTIADGDATHPRFDLFVIDESNIVTVVQGAPAANPQLPAVPNGKLLIDIVYVPANHVAGSTPVLPLGRESIIEVQRNIIKDWAAGTVYVHSMPVVEAGVMYRCLAAHVSAADFEDDFASGKWLELGKTEGTNEEEWQDSVLSIETDPSSLTPSTDDRYLIGGSAIGSWVGRDGQIAEWRGSRYRYLTPTDGMSVKVDNDDGKIYHHEGTYAASFAWVADALGGGGTQIWHTLTFKPTATSDPANGLYGTWAEIKTQVDALVAAGVRYTIMVDDSLGTATIDVSTNLEGATLTACIAKLIGGNVLEIADGVKITGEICSIENQLTLRSVSTTSVIDYTAGIHILTLFPANLESTTAPMITIGAGAFLAVSHVGGSIVNAGSEVFDLLDATSILQLFYVGEAELQNETISGVVGSQVGIDIKQPAAVIGQTHTNFIGSLSAANFSLSQQVRFDPAVPASWTGQQDVKAALDYLITVGGGGGGHTIQDEGTPLTQRTNLNFEGLLVTATDDAGNDATVVTINPDRIQRTYAQITADIAGGLLIPNAVYEITDVQSQFLGLLPPDFAGLVYATSYIATALSPTELSTSGLILGINGDYQGVGDYSGVTGTVGNLLGLYYKEYQVDINITSHGGGNDRDFRVPVYSSVQNQTLGTSAHVSEVITPPPVDPTATPYTVTVKVIMSDAQNEAGIWQNGDLITANDGAIQGTVTSVTDSWTPLVNDIVVWNNLHYRSLTGIVGDFPTVDATNWELISDLTTPATAETTGHILEWDRCIYDLENDFPVRRQDKRGNDVFISSGFMFQFFPVSILNTFPFGNDLVFSNVAEDVLSIVLKNFRGRFSENRMRAITLSYLYADGDPASQISNNILESGDFGRIMLRNGGAIANNNATSSGIDGNAVFGGRITSNTLTKNGNISDCYLRGAEAVIENCFIAGQIIYCELTDISLQGDEKEARITSCHIGSTSSLTGVTMVNSANGGCEIRGWHLEERADIGDSSVFGGDIKLTGGASTDGCKMEDFHIRAGCFITSFNLVNDQQILGFEFGIPNFLMKFNDLDFSLSFNNKLKDLKCVQGYSNIEVKITPSGASNEVLNFDDGVRDLRFAGIVYIEGNSQDETINQIQNFQGHHPVRIHGENGFTHTIVHFYETSGKFSLTEGDLFELTNEKDFIEVIVPQQSTVFPHDTCLEISRHRSRVGGRREGWLKKRLFQSNILQLGTIPFELKANAGSSVILWATKATVRLYQPNTIPYVAGGGGTLDMRISNTTQYLGGALLQDNGVTLGNGAVKFFMPFEIVNGINLLAGDGISLWLQGGIDPTGGDPADYMDIELHYVELTDA